MDGVDTFTWVALAAVVLAAMAMRSVWTSRVHATKVRAIWSAIVLIPFIGPVGWFVLGRERRRKP
jgi:hypothetical protein